jgi:uncharacterized protein (TIGR03067 family)
VKRSRWSSQDEPAAVQGLSVLTPPATIGPRRSVCQVFDERPALIMQAYTKLRAEPAPRVDEVFAQEVRELQKKLAELEREGHRLLDAYQAGLIEVDQLERRQRLLRQRRAHVQASLEAARGEQATALQRADLQMSIQSFARSIRTPLATLSFEERQRLVRTVIDRVMVEEGQVDIHFAIPVPGSPKGGPPGHDWPASGQRMPRDSGTIAVSGGCPVSSTWPPSRARERLPPHGRRSIVHRLISVMCWLILGTGLVPAFAQPAEEAQKKLRGTWTATRAERDGNAADDVVGHRLSFTGSRFQIQSKDGKLLYAGTVRLDESAKPAAIDFEHTEGALKGKAWKGIYALDGDTLTICDNAPNLDKGRPAAFEAKSGSGYVLITFKREKP